MPRVCVHLDQAADWEYAKAFSGVGIEYALVCTDCRSHPEQIEANLREVSPERFTQIEEGGSWDWDKDALIGRPQVLERATGLSFRHEKINLAGDIPGGIADIQPIRTSARPEWLVLAEDGDLFRVDLGRGSAQRLMNAFGAGPGLTPAWSLHVSPGGEMAAVVETRGRYGVVLDLEAGRPTMRLDRGTDHVEHSNFPAAFAEIDGRLLLVHGTDWNRLDISDPRTGDLLTDRSPTSYGRDEQRPQHDLDYFHGGLAVSPDGEWIVDNGWVWHPVGIVASWSLRRWLEDNPWESEDGPTKRDLCARNYYWDGPLCWIGGRTLAVWGYGNDEENLIPAAVLLRRRVGAPGPLVRRAGRVTGLRSLPLLVFQGRRDIGLGCRNRRAAVARPDIQPDGLPSRWGAIRHRPPRRIFPLEPAGADWVSSGGHRQNPLTSTDRIQGFHRGQEVPEVWELVDQHHLPAPCDGSPPGSRFGSAQPPVVIEVISPARKTTVRSRLRNSTHPSLLTVISVGVAKANRKESQVTRPRTTNEPTPTARQPAIPRGPGHPFSAAREARAARASPRHD